MDAETFGLAQAEWAGKTYEEIREVGKQDGSLLIVPVGSIEQHGPHLPVATDTILADAVAYLGAEQVADELPIAVLPPFWSGFSPGHMSLGGTVSLDFDVLLDALEAIADTGLENGFDAVLFLNSHGGNQAAISAAVTTVGSDHPDAEVLGLTYFTLVNEGVDDIRDSDIGGMSHAGEFETALMMHLRPDLVNEERIDGQHLEEPYNHGTHDLMDIGPLAVYREFEEYSYTGAIGAPDLATARKGEQILELLRDELETLFSDIYARNS